MKETFPLRAFSCINSGQEAGKSTFAVLSRNALPFCFLATLILF